MVDEILMFNHPKDITRKVSSFENRASIMKVIILESGKLEIDRLQFDIRHSIDSIFRHIPRGDMLGLDHILVTDLPLKKKGHKYNALGAYFKRQGNRQAGPYR